MLKDDCEVDELANGLQYYLYHSETDNIYAYVEYCFEIIYNLNTSQQSF